MSPQELNELADRLDDITEDAHGNPKPIDLSDRQQAARQLRHMATIEAKIKELQDQSNKRRNEIVSLTSTLAKLESAVKQLGYENGKPWDNILRYKANLAATHQKIQDWWWSHEELLKACELVWNKVLTEYHSKDSPVRQSVENAIDHARIKRADMESFMRERSIPMERPGGATHP